MMQERMSTQFEYVVFIAGLWLFGLMPVIIAIVLGIENVSVFVLFHLLVVTAIAVVLSRKSLKTALAVLIFVLPFQPLISMPVAKALGNTGVKLVISSKEVYVMALVGILFLTNSKKIKWGYIDLAAALFLLVHIYGFIYSSAGLFARAVSFREGIMILAFYYIGRLITFTQDDILWILKAIVVVSLIVALFGFLERFVFNDTIWNTIGAIDYYQAKIESQKIKFIIKNNLPGNFFTFIDNRLFRRMVGPIADATSLSRFLALPILSLIYIRRLLSKSRETLPFQFAALLLLCGALVLTFGRGGLLIVIGGLMLWSYSKKPFITVLLGIPLAAVVLGNIALFDIHSGNVSRHTSGLVNGVNSLYKAPLGHGLGSSGMMAVMYTENIEEDISESYWGSLSYQLGIAGLISFTMFFILICGTLYRIYKKHRGEVEEFPVSKMALMAFSLCAGIFATSALGNSAVEPISAGLSLLYGGAIIGINDNDGSLPIPSEIKPDSR